MKGTRKFQLTAFRVPPLGGSGGFSRISNSAASVAAVILALMLLGLGASRLVYPFDVGHYEACIWTPSMLSAQGNNPYAFSLQPPFVMAPYGYGYYLLVGLGLRAFGLQLWFGRALTILAAAVCLVCVVRIAFTLTRNRQAVWLAALSFLSAITLHHWLGVHRPDLPALAVAFAGLALIFHLTNQPDQDGRITPRAGLAVLLLAGAFFFKQTAILPAAVAVALCWQTGRRKLALFIAGTGLVFAAAAMLILNQTSDGQYFWQHFTLMQQVPHSYATSWRWVMSIFRTPAMWIIAGIIGVALLVEIRRRTWERSAFLRINAIDPRLLVILHFIGAAIFGFVTSARQGSYISYHLETFIVGSIVVALAWDSLSRFVDRPLIYRGLVVALLLAGGFQLIRQARGEVLRWRSLPYYREIVATLRREMPPHSLGISVHPELMTAAGHDYHFGDWNQYEDGRSAQLHQVFLDAVASKRYAAIVWLRDNAAAEFPGYHLAPMKQPLPQGYYPVFLYLRD
ncbi:MAG: hypothetical protein ABI977_29660 [Acidobacteriota bacterium]